MALDFDLGIGNRKEAVEPTSSRTTGGRLGKTARVSPERTAPAEPHGELHCAELDDGSVR